MRLKFTTQETVWPRRKNWVLRLRCTQSSKSSLFITQIKTNLPLALKVFQMYSDFKTESLLLPVFALYRKAPSALSTQGRVASCQRVWKQKKVKHFLFFSCEMCHWYISSTQAYSCFACKNSQWAPITWKCLRLRHACFGRRRAMTGRSYIYFRAPPRSFSFLALNSFLKWEFSSSAAKTYQQKHDGAWTATSSHNRMDDFGWQNQWESIGFRFKRRKRLYLSAICVKTSWAHQLASSEMSTPLPLPPLNPLLCFF